MLQVHQVGWKSIETRCRAREQGWNHNIRDAEGNAVVAANQLLLRQQSRILTLEDQRETRRTRITLLQQTIDNLRGDVAELQGRVEKERHDKTSLEGSLQ